MGVATKLQFDAGQIFHELNGFSEDLELLGLVKECLEAQKATGEEFLRASFRTNPNARQAVSEETLQGILASGNNVSDILTDRHISNCLVFNDNSAENALVSEQVRKLRKKVDKAISKRVKRLFQDGGRLAVRSSGHFWYPPGGYMGWHTNLKTPGWRMYINYCEESGKSFFRYRDPDSGNIVTTTDKQWNFRLFRITSEKPLWHAIYSDTNRFSIGYKIVQVPHQPFGSRLRQKIASLVR